MKLLCLYSRRLEGGLLSAMFNSWFPPKSTRPYMDHITMLRSRNPKPLPRYHDENPSRCPDVKSLKSVEIQRFCNKVSF